MRWCDGLVAESIPNRLTPRITNGSTEVSKLTPPASPTDAQLAWL